MYGDDKKRNNIIIFAVSLLFTGVLAFVLFKRFTFILSSNDDVMLKSIASGNYTGKPDAHLIYIMYPLGLIFKILYSLGPGISWYDGFMVGLHLLCFFLITYRMGCVFERLSNKLAGLIITFGIFTIMDVHFVVLHQYTVLAGVCAATAILWSATYDYSDKNIFSRVVVIVMLLLSLWLRKQMFFLAFPLLVMAILFRIFDKNETTSERFERFMDALLPIGIFAGLLIVSFVAETVAYSSPEWKTFKEYNKARTQVYDYNKLPDYYDNIPLYEGLDLSEGDYTVLREYDIVLLKNVDADTFNALANRADELKKEWEAFYSVPRKVINETVSTIYGMNATFAGVAVSLCTFALLIFFLLKDEKFAGLMVMLACIYEWSFVAYFTYLERLPERVTHGFHVMLLCFLTAMFVIVLKKERPARQPSLFWQISMSVALIFIMTVTGIYSLRTLMDKEAAMKADALDRTEINAYFKASPDNVYIINTSVEAALPALMFKDGSSEAFNGIMAGNWTLGGPIEKAHEGRLIARPVKDALMGDDNVYYVMLKEKPAEWLSEYFGTCTEKDSFTVSSGREYAVYRLK